VDRWGLAIIDGRYTAGDKIGPGDPVTALAVAEATASRAIGALGVLGLVAADGQGDIRVNHPSSWNSLAPKVIEWRMRSQDSAAQIHWLAQLRTAIEPMAAALAARNATTEQWTALAEYSNTLFELSNQGDSPEFLAADAAFHRTVLEACGNPMFASLGPTVAGSLEVRQTRGLLPKDASQRSIRLHGDVAVSIASGDATGAEMALRLIVRESEAAALGLLRAHRQADREQEPDVDQAGQAGQADQ
jgi:DNA-binding FadR family transcriptional regulator